MSNETRQEIITNRDRNINAIKAGLKLVPGVGDALIQFIFEKGQEARQRRLERTLQEVVDKFNERGIEDKLEGNEEFGEFLTKAADPISRSTNEDKRQRFRDLLFNSMQIPPGDPSWEESMHCLDELTKINSVGLYVLAMVEKAHREDKVLAAIKIDSSYNWLIVHKNLRNGIEIVAKSNPVEEVRYDEVLVTKALAILQSELGLILKRDSHVRFEKYVTGVGFYSLTPAGELLVKWTVADF